MNSEVPVLSKAITLVESGKSEHQKIAGKILEKILPHAGKSFRLGITGVPGVGKSTFIETFGNLLLEKNYKVAVLAVDPSSNKSKGSILGDKTRMEKLSAHTNAFIRPSPSGGSLGGVTKSTYEAMLLCEAAGFDFIIIETVGVGQSETAVSQLCDFFLLLMLAGAGDELQGIKRGIIEMADAIVITKADGDNIPKAKSTRTEFAHALHTFLPNESGWIPKVETCSAHANKGMQEIYDMLMKFRDTVTSNSYFETKRREQRYELLMNHIEEKLRTNFFSNKKIKVQLEKINKKKNYLPFSEASKLIKVS